MLIVKLKLRIWIQESVEQLQVLLDRESIYHSAHAQTWERGEKRTCCSLLGDNDPDQKYLDEAPAAWRKREVAERPMIQ